MAEKRFRKTRALDYCGQGIKPAERKVTLYWEMEDGRKAEGDLTPEQARWVANRMLLEIRQHFPEAAECPHAQVEYIAGTCTECGAQVRPKLGSPEARAQARERRRR